MAGGNHKRSFNKVSSCFSLTAGLDQQPAKRSVLSACSLGQCVGVGVGLGTTTIVFVGVGWYL